MESGIVGIERYRLRIVLDRQIDFSLFHKNFRTIEPGVGIPRMDADRCREILGSLVEAIVHCVTDPAVMQSLPMLEIQFDCCFELRQCRPILALGSKMLSQAIVRPSLQFTSVLSMLWHNCRTGRCFIEIVNHLGIIARHPCGRSYF